jgi:Protein of unknown function (DUF1592)/Protein of unknown function (DUF1588)/Protein of unknown function (DUF1587)/Protein of unknown function (DUF1595)/Protein of unknown function (DUF1585)
MAIPVRASPRCRHCLAVTSRARRPHPARHALLTGALLSACVGAVEGPASAARPGSPGSGAQPADAPTSGVGEAETALRCQSAPPDVGESLLRRLSNVEVELTLQDLFALPEPPDASELPPDNDVEGFKTFAEAQAMSAQHLQAYVALAGRLADGLLADPARRSQLIGCEPSEARCVSTFVARFGELAFRRLLGAAEVEAYAARALANALDADDRVRYAIQALISSPHFVYRVEVGSTPGAVVELSARELAAKLSFALWGRGPSRALMEAADRGELASAQGLRARADEMLRDPRARYFYTRFFRQWLGYEKLRAPVTPPAGWSDALMPAMQAEADTLLAEHAFGGAPFHGAFTASSTTLSPELATFYGLPAPDGAGTVALPTGHPRAGAGVLGSAALLAMKTDGDPVAVRGNWLRRTFFCRSLHIPPNIADQLGDLLVGLSPVQIVEKRNSEAACKGCHAQIDPIGVGLSQFDAAGRFSATLDPSVYGIAPALPDLGGVAFDSLASLAEQLVATPEVDVCLAEKVYTYLGGRRPEPEDACALQAGFDAYGGAYDFRALVAGVTASPSFRLRRPPADAGASE